METPLNILLTPDTTEIAYEQYESLKNERNITLFGLGTEPDSTLPIERQVCSPIHGTQFIQELAKCVDDFKIDYILGSHDLVFVPILSRSSHANKLITSTGQGGWIICRSKSLTYKVLGRKEIAVPQVIDLPDTVFMKPDAGYGSRQAASVNMSQYSNFLVTENIPGNEYTVDCFSEGGELQFCSPRRRCQTRGGVATLSLTESELSPLTDELAKIARVISDVLSFHGPWFFQVKQRGDSSCVVLEVAPRIAGSSGASRLRGVNGTLLSLYLATETDIEWDHIRSGRVETSRRLQTDLTYFSHAYCRPHDKDYVKPKIYVDYDDTFKQGPKYNHELVGKLIGLKGAGYEIRGLSRNQSSISDRLFASVISNWHGVTQGHKHSLMDKPAILIDDSYWERKNALGAGFLAIGNDQLEILDYLIRKAS